MPAQGLTFRDQRLLKLPGHWPQDRNFFCLTSRRGGLNEGETDELLSLLKSMPAGKNIGILIVDHDMRLIMKLCNRLHTELRQDHRGGSARGRSQRPGSGQSYLGVPHHE